MYQHRILICYNEPVNFYSNYLGKKLEDETEIIDLSETEFKNNLEGFRSLLMKNFSEVSTLGFTRNIQKAITSIKKIKPDVIFNFVESIEGDTDFEAHIPGLFEIVGIPYTGNNSLCLGNCLNKLRTKQLLTFKGISTSPYQVLKSKVPFTPKTIKLNYPIIIKLITEDASIGISENSVVSDFEALNKQCKFLFRNYGKDLILEEYIKGRELNVAILGGQVLPISEISFNGLPKDLPKIVTYEAKWSPGSVYYTNTVPICPAKLDKEVEDAVKETALEAYYALGCRDYARVDIRLDKNLKPYVIEVNPNPDISPDTGFVRSAGVAGINYDELLKKLAHFAINRIKHDKAS